MKLQGEVAFVTGATSGIGEAIAERLAREGAVVFASGRRKERLDALEKRVREAGGTLFTHVLDVQNLADVKAAVLECERVAGPVTICVANSGVMLLSEIKKTKTDEWERMVDTNLKGVMWCAAAMVPGMIDRDKGYFIGISSIAGKNVFPYSSVYSATKFGVNAFLEGLRQETSATNVRIGSIGPGTVKSELTFHITDPDVYARWSTMRAYDPLLGEDIADAVVFMASAPARMTVNDIMIRPTQQSI